MTKNKPVVMQLWLESEAGWGQRPDGCSLHLTTTHLEKFNKAYWAKMPAATPSEYSRPCSEPKTVLVDAKMLAIIKKNKGSFRTYENKKIWSDL